MSRRDRAADAIVVGAGPAGATTALRLARAGVRVLLLDRAAFPRSKPCGDCLSAAATDLLRELGLLDRVLDAGAATLEGWRIFAPDGTMAVGRFHDSPSLALERRRLDAVLLDAAREAGAGFHQAHVTDLVRTDGRVRGVVVRLPDGPTRRLTAPLVIGADGLRSVVARRLGRVRRPPRLRKVSLTAHFPARDTLRCGEMHILADACIGYAPSGSDTRNLTVVVGADSALARRGPAAVLRDHLGAAPGLESRLEDALAPAVELGDDEILASGPFDWPSRGPVAHGAALVGDAAGYYDPFTGQGIHQGMAAGVLLADAVASVLADSPTLSEPDLDRALRQYARRKRRLTRPVRRFQWAVEQAISRPWLADRAVDRLARAPAAARRVVEVAGDLRRPRSLLSPAVALSFLFPPSGGPVETH